MSTRTGPSPPKASTSATSGAALGSVWVSSISSSASVRFLLDAMVRRGERAVRNVLRLGRGAQK